MTGRGALRNVPLPVIYLFLLHIPGNSVPVTFSQRELTEGAREAPERSNNCKIPSVSYSQISLTNYTWFSLMKLNKITTELLPLTDNFNLRGALGKYFEIYF